MIIAEPAVPGTRHLGLGLKLYPINKLAYSSTPKEEMKESLS